MEDRYQIRKYLDLMDAMLSGDMTATEFESRYLRTFKEDDALRPYEVFTTLDGLFADVDAFVADPATTSRMRDEASSPPAHQTRRRY